MALSYSDKNNSIIESKNEHHGFYYLNCHHFFETANKLESHKKLCRNKDFSIIAMYPEDTEISQFNQNQKFDKAQFVIYAHLVCLIEKIDGCKTNPESWFKAKVREHIKSDFSIFTISLFKKIEKEHDVYRGKDCMKNFCESLRQCEIKITNFMKGKKLLTKD